MVNLYVSVLENREIYYKTEETWRIQDVPVLWRNKVRSQVIADGYRILDDGTVKKATEE